MMDEGLDPLVHSIQSSVCRETSLRTTFVWKTGLYGMMDMIVAVSTISVYERRKILLDKDHT